MNPTVSSDTFDTFFAWAPWVVGIAIYLAFYFAKRREVATSSAAAQATGSQAHAAQTFPPRGASVPLKPCCLGAGFGVCRGLCAVAKENTS